MATLHKYGPHRPEDAPTLVDIAPPGRDPDLRPIPHLLVRQRALLNTIAHHGRHSRGLCRTCSLDEWDCLSVRPGPDDHSYEPARP